jgi:hypothetical protein
MLVDDRMFCVNTNFDQTRYPFFYWQIRTEHNHERPSAINSWKQWAGTCIHDVAATSLQLHESWASIVMTIDKVSGSRVDSSAITKMATAAQIIAVPRLEDQCE